MHGCEAGLSDALFSQCGIFFLSKMCAKYLQIMSWFCTENNVENFTISQQQSILSIILVCANIWLH